MIHLTYIHACFFRLQYLSMLYKPFVLASNLHPWLFFKLLCFSVHYKPFILASNLHPHTFCLISVPLATLQTFYSGIQLTSTLFLLNFKAFGYSSDLLFWHPTYIHALLTLFYWFSVLFKHSVLASNFHPYKKPVYSS